MVVLAAAAYLGFFLLLGAVFRRAVAVSLGYVVVFEQVLGGALLPIASILPSWVSFGLLAGWTDTGEGERDLPRRRHARSPGWSSSRCWASASPAGGSAGCAPRPPTSPRGLAPRASALRTRPCGRASIPLRIALPARVAATSVVGSPGSRYIRRVQRGSIAAAVDASSVQAGRAGVASCTFVGIGGNSTNRAASRADAVTRSDGRCSAK